MIDILFSNICSRNDISKRPNSKISKTIFNFFSLLFFRNLRITYLENSKIKNETKKEE